MRTLPIALAAAGAISLLSAAAPAKADWDDHERSGWRDRDWRSEEWREHHRAWGPGHFAWRPGYAYGYAAPIVRYHYGPPVVRYAPPIVRYRYGPPVVHYSYRAPVVVVPRY